MPGQLFKKGSGSTLGIDISSSSIKAVELSTTTDLLFVNNYGREVLPKGAMEGNRLKDISAISQTLSRLIKNHGLKSKKAVIAVPDSLVITKTIQIPAQLQDQALDEQVLFEAEKHIPYSLNEIYLDFLPLNLCVNNTRFREVLLVATRREHVVNRIAALTEAGLSVHAVDVESFAIKRILSIFQARNDAEQRDSVVAILDLGACFFRLHVWQADKLLFSREEMFNGMLLLESVALNYGLTLDSMMAFFFADTMPLPGSHNRIEPLIANLISAVNRVLGYFNSTASAPIDHLYLTGGTACIESLPQRLTQQIGVAASAIHDSELVGLKGKRMSPMLTALGLAAWKRQF